MDLGLTDKTALVGGGSRGLGRAIAAALSREGARVAIVARDRQVLEETARDISASTGRTVKPVAADLSVPEQARKAAGETLEAFGRVDILVNNAGGPPSGYFADFSDEAWDQAFRLNLMSAVNMTREVLPGMKERRWGRIVNMTSIAVKQPLDGLMLSNSIRAGVHGWAKSLAAETAAFGVTVNNVLPGYTATDRVRRLARSQAEREGLTENEIVARMNRSVPMRRLASPEEVGDLVAYLASEKAAYITGVSIQIDGGFHSGLM